MRMSSQANGLWVYLTWHPEQRQKPLIGSHLVARYLLENPCAPCSLSVPPQTSHRPRFLTIRDQSLSASLPRAAFLPLRFLRGLERRAMGFRLRTFPHIHSRNRHRCPQKASIVGPWHQSQSHLVACLIKSNREPPEGAPIGPALPLSFAKPAQIPRREGIPSVHPSLVVAIPP